MSGFWKTMWGECRVVGLVGHVLFSVTKQACFSWFHVLQPYTLLYTQNSLRYVSRDKTWPMLPCGETLHFLWSKEFYSKQWGQTHHEQAKVCSQTWSGKSQQYGIGSEACIGTWDRYITQAHGARSDRLVRLQNKHRIVILL